MRYVASPVAASPPCAPTPSCTYFRALATIWRTSLSVMPLLPNVVLNHCLMVSNKRRKALRLSAVGSAPVSAISANTSSTATSRDRFLLVLILASASRRTVSLPSYKEFIVLAYVPPSISRKPKWPATSWAIVKATSLPVCKLDATRYTVLVLGSYTPGMRPVTPSLAAWSWICCGNSDSFSTTLTSGVMAQPFKMRSTKRLTCCDCMPGPAWTEVRNTPLRSALISKFSSASLALVYVSVAALAAPVTLACRCRKALSVPLSAASLASKSFINGVNLPLTLALPVLRRNCMRR